MITEYDVWKMMYEKWLNPQLKIGYNIYRDINYNSGLCFTLEHLHSVFQFSADIYEKILNTIDKLPNYPGSLFKWPRTLEGAKQRAEFCKQQMEKCK